MPLEALGPFIGVAKFLRSGLERRDDLTRSALSSLSKALFETRLYLRSQERGQARDQTREDAIVHLWAEASGALRGVDSDLATICHYKAEYWIDPEGWTDATIADRRIGIDALFVKYGELLHVSGATLTPENKSLIRKLVGKS